MVLKSTRSGYRTSAQITKRHQRAGVGETYVERKRVELNQSQALSCSKGAEAQRHRSIGRRIKDFIFGRSGVEKTIDDFKANAHFVSGYNLAEIHKELENGIKDGPASDADLIGMLAEIEKQFS